MLYQVLSAAALVLSVGGNILINLKKRIGFVVWIVSNTTWVVVNLIALQTNWFQTMMFVVFIGLNVHGLFNWRKTNSSDGDQGK